MVHYYRDMWMIRLEVLYTLIEQYSQPMNKNNQEQQDIMILQGYQ